MVTFELFVPEHYMRLKPHLVYCGEELPVQLAPNINAITVLHSGAPVAIIGANELFRGMWNIWSIFSDDIKKTPAVFLRRLKRLCDDYMKRRDVRRAQMSVSTSNRSGWRLAEFLGFKSEGVMKAYGVDGSDYVLFARINYERS